MKHLKLPGLLLGALLLACTALPARAQACAGGAAMSRAALTGVLHRGGFSGVLDDSASVRYVGCLRTPREELGLYYYERVWGEARRMTARLIVVSNRARYLGMYSVPERPRSVRGSRIVFAVPRDYGNAIVLHHGKLPRRVLLDGEVREFFR